LLLIRGIHYCCENNRVEKLKQFLIGKAEKLIGLQALCSEFKIDVHQPMPVFINETNGVPYQWTYEQVNN
jgi:hypothetical protein